jgi:hypothetical protein
MAGRPGNLKDENIKLISLRIAEDLYFRYRAICEHRGEGISIDLKRHIEEVVKNGISCS